MGYVPISRADASDTKRLLAILERRRRERMVFYLVMISILGVFIIALSFR